MRLMLFMVSVIKNLKIRCFENWFEKKCEKVVRFSGYGCAYGLIILNWARLSRRYHTKTNYTLSVENMV